MKIDAQPSFIDRLSSGNKSRLSRLNQRIAKGSEEVLASPNYDQISDEDLLSRVGDIISKSVSNEKLLKIEDSQRSKFGPRSLAKNWEDRRESLFAYFQHSHDETQFETGGLEPRGNLRPASITTAAERLIKSSSTGLPYMTRKGVLLDTVSPEVLLLEAGEYPCVLFTRTQEEGKTRNIWGYPIGDTLKESQYFIPFQSVERNLGFRAALGGPDHVDKAISQLLFSRKESDLVYCVDFAGYDASISPTLIQEAFGFIASHFQRSFTADFARLFERFTSIPIYTPDGEISGRHGVPSGSSFTNTIDSLVQWQVSGYHRVGFCEIQGDDGVYLVRRDEQSEFEERFRNSGITLNTDKSEVFLGNEAVYLQRYYHPEFRTADGHLGGVYPLTRALMRLKYLEKWTDFEREGIAGSDFFSLRALMILENCKHHPGFVEFVRMAQEIDRDGLRFTNRGLHAYSKMQESRARAGALPVSEMRTGIRSFETVKVLEGLR